MGLGNCPWPYYVRAVAALAPSQIFLVVHRVDFSVYFRRIEGEEFALLSALRGGKTLERAIELAFQGSSIPEFDRGDTFDTVFGPGQLWARSAGRKKRMRGEKAARKE